MAQLPDDLVNQLLENIGELAVPYAKAKSHTRRLEEHRKITKASLMKMARGLGQASSREAAEIWAYTHPQYKEVSDQMIQAIEDEVIAQDRYENSVREWESWRTLCANDRHITRAG